MKIKKILSLGLILTSFIAISWGHINELNSKDNAVVGIKIGNNQPSGGSDECFSFSGIITIKLANLNVGGETPEIPEPGSIGTLPSQYPDMILELNLFGTTTSYDLNEFEFWGISASGEPVFVWELPYNADASDYCKGPGNLIPWSYSLRTDEGLLYPVHNYSSPYDIFSCQVFEKTCYDCNEECEGGVQNSKAYWPESYACDDRDDCYGDISGDDRSQEIETNLSSNTINVSPNPFNSDFVFEIELETVSSINISILNANGSLVKQISKNASRGLYRERILTQNWESGVYFVKVKVNDHSEVFRLIKV